MTMTSTILTTCKPVRPTARQACVFLGRYGALLLGCGATCIRLQKNMDRIARTWGITVSITIMPRHLHITVTDPEGDDLFTAIDAVPHHCPVSFSLNTRLSRLSWEVADGHLDYYDTLGRFERIVKDGAGGLSFVPELVLVACANASFCRLFGGDFIAMAVVAIATMAGYYLKVSLLKRHVDLRVAVIASAFVSAVLAAGDALFSLGSTPDVALGTSVLYLVPGVPFLNSFSDMLYRHYICAFSRLVDAVVLTVCLSAGLCAGMLFMNQGMF